MPTIYRAEGFRPIRQSEDIRTVSDAAKVFAGRMARRQYGRREYVRTVRPDSWAADGSSHTFEVFIGVDGPQHGTTIGRNEWLYVHVAH